MASSVNKKILSCGILEKLKTNYKKYANVKESKSILAIYEDYIFVWHDAGSCILSVEINSAELKDVTYKTLTLTNPPVFDVESILFNQTGSLLALFGKNGVMVFEVPWRYGKFSTVAVNNETISGRSWNVAEYFFVCSNRISVVQALWHPGSSSNTHLTVLSTDNYIRIYDVTEPQAPLHVISLGANANSYLSSDAKISFSTCFGENAVSFDFGLPVKSLVLSHGDSRKVKNLEEQTVWPIYLLHGNGDVYVLKTPLKKERFSSATKLEGPLPMYPPAEDNYGYDACSILCLHSVPMSIVIATAAGMIYHCILLKNQSSNLQKEEQNESSTYYGTSEKCDSALYVFESVELPLSLTEEQDDVYSRPIRLYKDINSHSKYHCTHVSGLHSVALPFLQSIEECLNTDGLEKLLSEEKKQPCIVEHILCTKPFSQVNPVPVLGLDVSVGDAGMMMICLLASWEFVCLPLVSSYFAAAPHLLTENFSTSKDQSKLISTFEQHLEKSLQRSLCSPFVKSISSSSQGLTSPQQWLDLLCSITQRYREDYIQRLNTALALLRSRVKVLAQQKEYQLMDIARCNQEKENLKSGAERLAEKYEDAHAAQQKLFLRIENTLQKLMHHLPYLSKAESAMKQTLLSYEENLKTFETSLDQIKKKVKYQAERTNDLKTSNQQIQYTVEAFSDLNLNETQVKHIKELLSQEGESIAELMQMVTSLKKQNVL